MKHCVIAFCLFLAALAVHAEGIREEMNLEEKQARVSYAFGMMVGDDLQQAGLEIDYAAFTEGLKAAMEQAEARLSRNEARELVQDSFEVAMDKQAMEMREKELTFLIENAEREGVITTESGLQYMVLEEGSGPKPTVSDTVIVHYEGSLADGRVFDSSYQKNQPEEIPLDMVIPGWAEGIQLMNVGSKHRLFIPSNLAYGERGAGQVIPPYSTLIFTIELIDIANEESEE